MYLFRPRARTLATGAAALALLAGATEARAAARALTTDKGVVQAVSPTSIVLRGLDGSSVSLTLGPATRVRLNGAAARLGDLRPGLVASVTHNGNRPARVVRAFGAAKVVEEGVVDAVTELALVLRRADGTSVTIELGPQTRVRRLGRLVARRAIRPGRLVRVTYRPGAPALLVAVVARPG